MLPKSRVNKKYIAKLAQIIPSLDEPIANTNCKTYTESSGYWLFYIYTKSIKYQTTYFQQVQSALN